MHRPKIIMTTPEHRRERLKEWYESFVRVENGAGPADVYRIRTEPAACSGEWKTVAYVCGTDAPLTKPIFTRVPYREHADFHDAKRERLEVLLASHHRVADQMYGRARRDCGYDA